MGGNVSSLLHRRLLLCNPLSNFGGCTSIYVKFRVINGVEFFFLKYGTICIPDLQKPSFSKVYLKTQNSVVSKHLDLFFFLFFWDLKKFVTTIG